MFNACCWLYAPPELTCVMCKHFITQIIRWSSSQLLSIRHTPDLLIVTISLSTDDVELRILQNCEFNLMAQTLPFGRYEYFEFNDGPAKLTAIFKIDTFLPRDSNEFTFTSVY